MKSVATSGIFTLLLLLNSATSLGAQQPHQDESNIHQRKIGEQVVQSERDEQAALFNYYFRDQGLKYETELTKLKTRGSVPSWRIPYSAHIHPERRGGLADSRFSNRLARSRPGRNTDEPRNPSVLRLYDFAFHEDEDLANSFEISRITRGNRGLRIGRITSEGWEGYCSGFTASTIRHPEPVKPVDAGEFGGKSGVIFQPAEIKALLTAIYNRTTDDSFLFLAPPSVRSERPNAGTLHLALANYLGNAKYPIGIDRTPGQISWNNPIYSFESKMIGPASNKNGLRYQRVQTKITYTFYGSDNLHQTNAETGDRVRNNKRTMTLNYLLTLDMNGHIVGGRALNSHGHFLWIPLYAVQAKLDGSTPGNPYLDVQKVLAMARASARPDIQAKYDASQVGPLLDPSLIESKQTIQPDKQDVQDQVTASETSTSGEDTLAQSAGD